jgi:serine/threonine protein kinase
VNAMDLLLKLCDINADSRIDAKTAFNHDFFNESGFLKFDDFKKELYSGENYDEYTL